MKRDIESDHPIRHYFSGVLHEALHDRLGLVDDETVDSYLTDLLLGFLHSDSIFAIKDNAGRRIESVAEMVMEGDVRFNADSFAREREVHRHIGDFVLFWTGVFPEFLEKHQAGKDLLVNYTQQGILSYHVVSTFEHDPYGNEAPVFKKLSAEFHAYQYGLSLVRASFEGFARQGWYDGFSA